MSSSGYTAWAVTAGEVPTTAYWNILGSNDASFNTGNGFNDGILQNRHIGSSFLSTGVQTYTPTVTSSSGGTWSGQAGYYINIGGMKLCWGTISFSSASSSVGHVLFSLPTSFFTTVQMAIPGIQGEGNLAYQTASGDSIQGSPPSGFGFYINNTGTGGSCLATWWIVGT